MDDSREDILISRIVGGEAGDRAWQELEALAVDDPGLWRRLAEAHRDEAALAAVVKAAGAVAERVSVDPEEHAAPPPVIEFPARRRAWAGWAAAAMLLLAWIVAGPGSKPRAPRSMEHANIVPSALTSREAFDRYLEQGRAEGTVLSEEPRRVLLQTRPAPSGEGYELIYVQQILERAVVPDLYRISGVDERGQPGVERVDERARGRM